MRIILGILLNVRGENCFEDYHGLLMAIIQSKTNEGPKGKRFILFKVVNLSQILCFRNQWSGSFI